MEGEQRDPKNTTKNLFAGLSANENDQQQHNGAGKRRRVSFGRRITYFQPSSGTQSSTSSYVRMTSPTPTPSPLPPEFFDETYVIFDQLQEAQTAVEATRTIRKEAETAIYNESDADNESPSSPAVNVDTTRTLGEHIIFGDNVTHVVFDRFQQQPNSPAMVGTTQILREDTGGYGNNETDADNESPSSPAVNVDTTRTLGEHTIFGDNVTHVVFDRFQQQPNSPAMVGTTQILREDTGGYGNNETDDNIDISSIPGDELLAKTEREYYAVLRGYTQEKKRFYDLQNKKMELLERLKDRKQKMCERNRALWANMEHDVKEVLREVQKFNGPK